MIAIQQKHNEISKRLYTSDIHRTENGYYDCFEAYDSRSDKEYLFVEDMHGDIHIYCGSSVVQESDIIG